MSAEAIAKVVADLRAGRVRSSDEETKKWNDGFAFEGPVVDATAIYHSLVAKDHPIALYEDHSCIAPPWESSLVCYQNEHGNVLVMYTFISEETWKAENVPDWSKIKWKLTSMVYLGGASRNLGPFQTTGPVHVFQFAIEPDGTPADIHWVHLMPDYPLQHWDMAQLTLLGALNFMNCRNVELVTPTRPRAQARRLERSGVDVKNINVFPVGKSSRSASGDPLFESSAPLTSVRGHFAEYGINGKGLLFGKLSGRYWIPQFARGNKEVGEVQHDYTLKPQ